MNDRTRYLWRRRIPNLVIVALAILLLVVSFLAFKWHNERDGNLASLASARKTLMDSGVWFNKKIQSKDSALKESERTSENRQIDIDSLRVELQCALSLADFGDVVQAMRAKSAVRIPVRKIATSVRVSPLLDKLVTSITDETCKEKLSDVLSGHAHARHVYASALSYQESKQRLLEQKKTHIPRR